MCILMFVKDSPHLFYVDDAHVCFRKITNTRIPKAYKEASHSFLDEPNITHSKGRELLFYVRHQQSLFMYILFLYTPLANPFLFYLHMFLVSLFLILYCCYFPRSLFQSLILEILTNVLSTSSLFLGKRRTRRILAKVLPYPALLFGNKTFRAEGRFHVTKWCLVLHWFPIFIFLVPGNSKRICVSREREAGI